MKGRFDMKNFKIYLSKEGQKKVAAGQMPEQLKKVLSVVTNR